MSFQVPNGATIDIATAYGTSASITALSNAAPAVATAVNTLAAGDIVEVVSGWNMLNNGAFKVASPSGTAFSLAGVDTANATVYPAGNGIGTFRKVTAWQRMSEVTGFTASGGEQEYAEVQYLESLKKTKFPTIKGSMSAEFMVSDAMDAASLAALTAADLDQTQRAVKVTLPNGKVLMFSATVSMSKMPSMKENENMTRKIKMELTSDVVKV